MTTQTDASDDADRSEALTVMRRIFDEGFATGDQSVADQLLSPQLFEHQFGLTGEGPSAVATSRRRSARSTLRCRTSRSRSRTGLKLNRRAAHRAVQKSSARDWQVTSRRAAVHA